ncbi:two-component regulator propeller domain-containing protein [Algibacter miyuki]|uniref:histidine kinase n=1 Tax=Algibacter miyuki TaxID=1306933 RepID=A0ABV5H2Q2_9FLAO|nr:hybrid sensor histidine kinase/response regulator transcription factor [Algibacter miyuki]MDN3663834.1 two-component regulator propeller domain-containing protein [Algibacter miyuki]
MNWRLYIVFLSLCVSFSALGQFKNLKFENLDKIDGLSSSTCSEIFQDSDGYLWFGTIDGLNKYNGYGFEVFRPNLNDSTSISNIRINTITEDKNGNLWIGTNNGLDILNKKTQQFSRVNIFESESQISNTNEVINKLLFDEVRNTIWVATNKGAVKIVLKEGDVSPSNLKITRFNNNENDKNSLDDNYVNVVLKDENNNIWLSTNGACLNKYNEVENNFERVLIENKRFYELNHISKRVFIDNDGDFWIGNDVSNLILWNPKNHSFNHVSIVENKAPIQDFYQDENGIIWISTDGYGLLLYNKQEKKLEQSIVNNPFDPFSLPNNQPSKIFQDRDGVFWIGSYDKGVSKLDPSKNFFGHHYYQPNNPDGLSEKIVQSVLQDSKGRIWLGAYNGGLNLYDPETNTFRNFAQNPNNKNALSSNKILYTFESYNGDIWICTYDGGLNKFNPETDQFERFFHDEKNPLTIEQNAVWTGVEDAQKRIWLGLKSEGLNIYNPKNKTFHSYKKNLASNNIFTVFIDSKNRLLIGTNLGLNVLDLNTLTEFIPKTLDFSEVKEKGITGQKINFITEDVLHNIWLGTDNGVFKLDTNLKVLKSYASANGLPNNFVVGLVEDDDKNFWVTTKNGLSFINTKTDQIKNFNTHDGVQGAEFQSKSITKIKDGRIIAGGINGFNIFNPKRINLKSAAVLKPKITGFRLNNKKISYGDSVNGRVLLNKAISQTNHIELQHNENYISFEFEALFYNNPEHVKYAYKMHGIDDSFITVDNSRVVNQANLLPGTYTFEVIASIDNAWDKSESAVINIEILPPLWKTWWAYSIYFILTIGLVWFFMRLYSKTIQESQERNLDLMKLQFFINVSHEFRTPLTLILNPLEKILGNLSETTVVKSSALSAQRSARRLLHLVNQLLDYRKMDAGMAPLQLEKGDIVKFSEAIFDLFKGLAEKKEINYRFISSSGEVISLFDFDKVEKIITNLISNAIKFTESGGDIVVSITHVTEEANASGVFKMKKAKLGEHVEIVIKDTGIGMDKEQQEQVFSRFSNLDASKSGTGIGLNFTKALVEIHEGAIAVKSKFKKGTKFVVRLPLNMNRKEETVESIKNEFLINSMKAVEYDMLTSDITVSAENSKPENPESKTILIVEDNSELRAHLKDDLNDTYIVKEAVNGKEGLEMVLKHYPDIIISDVMMPKMDGFEMCKNLKAAFETCHIPIILLTARSREADLISGFNQGADAYIAKPFRIAVLKARIKNLLDSKERLKEKFSKLGAILPSKELTTNSLDEAFIEKVTKFVLDNISDPDFKIADILKEIGLGKSQFYRKIQSITGQNPSGFIRTIRLKRASELLLNSHYSIKEISYMCGFNSTTYFGKTFKDLFGVSPTEYLENNKKEL